SSGPPGPRCAACALRTRWWTRPAPTGSGSWACAWCCGTSTPTTGAALGPGGSPGGPGGGCTPTTWSSCTTAAATAARRWPRSSRCSPPSPRRGSGSAPCAGTEPGGRTTAVRSAAAMVGERGERGLGLPGHVGVGMAEAALEDLDHAGAGHVQVQAGVAAVRQVVAGEGVHEGAVDALGGEDVQHLAQVGGLLVLVAGVVAVEADR